jgi:hypothetical protein
MCRLRGRAPDFGKVPKTGLQSRATVYETSGTVFCSVRSTSLSRRCVESPLLAESGRSSSIAGCQVENPAVGTTGRNGPKTVIPQQHSAQLELWLLDKNGAPDKHAGGSSSSNSSFAAQVSPDTQNFPTRMPAMRQGCSRQWRWQRLL